jgi:hypothetical protein
MKIKISLQDSGFRAMLRRVILGAPQSVREVNRRYQAILLTEARKSASGRPGPEVESGAFIGAMKTGVEDRGYAVYLENNSPQAARLEFGFVGVDALGRHYAQPPYPWLLPTFARVAKRYQTDQMQAMEKLING